MFLSEITVLTSVNHSEILYCHCDCCAGIFQICRAHQNQLKWVDFRPCFIKMAKWQSLYFSPIIILLLQYFKIVVQQFCFVKGRGTCGSEERNVKILLAFRKSPSQLREKSCHPVFTKCGEPWIWNLLLVYFCAICRMYRLAYPYDFGVRLTIFWAILRPYDCCQFPYDLANLWYFQKVFDSSPSFLCGSVYYRSYRHFRLLTKRCQNVKILVINPKLI